MGKKLVAARDLPPNHVLSLEDIAIKSPSDGTPPFELDRMLGLVTRRAFSEDDNIAFEDLDGRR
jgi:N-acetylneuraminate synthase/sialic acid synthase